MSDDLAARKEAVKAKMQARDAQIREDWVKAMETRLVREELDKCHRAEGVNHYENCKWLADLYLQKMRENKLRGIRNVDV